MRSLGPQKSSEYAVRGALVTLFVVSAFFSAISSEAWHLYFAPAWLLGLGPVEGHDLALRGGSAAIQLLLALSFLLRRPGQFLFVASVMLVGCTALPCSLGLISVRAIPGSLGAVPTAQPWLSVGAVFLEGAALAVLLIASASRVRGEATAASLRARQCAVAKCGLLLFISVSLLGCGDSGPRAGAGGVGQAPGTHDPTNLVLEGAHGELRNLSLTLLGRVPRFNWRLPMMIVAVKPISGAGGWPRAGQVPIGSPVLDSAARQVGVVVVRYGPSASGTVLGVVATHLAPGWDKLSALARRLGEEQGDGSADDPGKVTTLRPGNRVWLFGSQTELVAWPGGQPGVVASRIGTAALIYPTSRSSLPSMALRDSTTGILGVMRAPLLVPSQLRVDGEGVLGVGEVLGTTWVDGSGTYVASLGVLPLMCEMVATAEDAESARVLGTRTSSLVWQDEALSVEVAAEVASSLVSMVVPIGAGPYEVRCFDGAMSIGQVQVPASARVPDLLRLFQANLMRNLRGRAPKRILLRILVRPSDEPLRVR